MFNKYIGLGIIMAVILTATFCFAAMVDIPLSELVKGAPVIVTGRVIDLESHWLNGPDSTIITEATVEVQEVLKGSPEKIIKIKVYGGEIEGIGLAVSTEPIFKAGEEVVLLLTKENDGLYRPTQLILSKYTVVDNNIIENNMVADEFIKEIKSYLK